MTNPFNNREASDLTEDHLLKLAEDLKDGKLSAAPSHLVLRPDCPWCGVAWPTHMCAACREELAKVTGESVSSVPL